MITVEFTLPFFIYRCSVPYRWLLIHRSLRYCILSLRLRWPIYSGAVRCSSEWWVLWLLLMPSDEWYILFLGIPFPFCCCSLLIGAFILLLLLVAILSTLPVTLWILMITYALLFFYIVGWFVVRYGGICRDMPLPLRWFAADDDYWCVTITITLLPLSVMLPCWLFDSMLPVDYRIHGCIGPLCSTLPSWTVVDCAWLPAVFLLITLRLFWWYGMFYVVCWWFIFSFCLPTYLICWCYVTVLTGWPGWALIFFDYIVVVRCRCYDCSPVDFATSFRYWLVIRLPPVGDTCVTMRYCWLFYDSLRVALLLCGWLVPLLSMWTLPLLRFGLLRYHSLIRVACYRIWCSISAVIPDTFYIPVPLISSSPPPSPLVVVIVGICTWCCYVPVLRLHISPFWNPRYSVGVCCLVSTIHGNSVLLPVFVVPVTDLDYGIPFWMRWLVDYTATERCRVVHCCYLPVVAVRCWFVSSFIFDTIRYRDFCGVILLFVVTMCVGDLRSLLIYLRWFRWFMEGAALLPELFVVGCIVLIPFVLVLLISLILLYLFCLILFFISTFTIPLFPPSPSVIRFVLISGPLLLLLQILGLIPVCFALR